MKEGPILFSGPMVQAILDDRKTVTRRIVKPQLASKSVSFGCIAGQGFGFIFGQHDVVVKCPYGTTGDRLWVRETFLELRQYHLQDPQSVRGAKITVGNRPICNGIEYRADSSGPESERCRRELGYNKWKPSIFMPRSASRITLEIVATGVERLHNISNKEAEREGFEDTLQFAELWKKLNGKESWDANPWVWRVEFKRV